MRIRHSFGLRVVSTALLSLPVLASLASAQSTALEREVEFTRQLATRLRFIELAQAHTATLQKTYTDSEDFKQVSQLDIEISLIGARAHPNREERRALFQDGLEKSSEFIDRYSNDPIADDARITMVQACVRFGEFLTEELEVAREEAPDQVPEIEERAAEIYRRGIEVCDQFLKSNRSEATSSSASPALAQKYFFCWLNKGILQRENARAVKRDREPLAELARETFEELILEIGEESLLGLRGYFEMSRIGEVLGDYKTAVRDYSDTIDSIAISLDSEDLDLSAWLETQLLDLMQEAYAANMQALLNDGQSEKVLEKATEFRSQLVKFAGGGKEADELDIYDLTTDFGHSALLTEARALAESGDAEKVSGALTQIRKINDLHPDDIIGIRAKSVLSQVLELNSGDSSIVTGSTLFEVAKGEYQSRNYEPAIRGFKRAYAVMTEDETKKFGFDLWELIGRAYGQQKRYAESSFAFARALEVHGADVDEPGKVADRLDRTWSSYRRSTNNDDDAEIERADSRFGGLIQRFADASNAAKRFWKDGQTLISERKYAKAREAYKKVTPDSHYYETAQSRIALTLRQENKLDEARKVIQDYRAWLETKDAEIPANDRTGAQSRRDQTLAQMAYYEVAMDYDVANPRQGKKDTTKFPALITRITNFLETYSVTGKNYFSQCYDMQAQLHAELGQLDKAEATYRTLKTEFAGSPYIASLATRLFAANNANVKALETEYESQAKDDADQNTLRTTFEKLQAARRGALSIALDYASTSTKPSYAMLSNAVSLGEDLKDWPTVEKVGRQARELFGDSKKFGKKVAKSIVPAIGEALLRQKKFRDAEAALREALKNNPKDYASIRLLALALGGWIDLDERLTEVAEVALDNPVEAYQLMFVDYRKYVKAKYDDYTIEWYRFMWEAYLFAKRASEKGNSKYAGYAQTIFRKAEGQEDFETLNTLGIEGKGLYILFTSNRI